MLATGSQARMLRWAADEWTTVPPIASTCARSATSPLMSTSARPIGSTSIRLWICFAGFLLDAGAIDVAKRPLLR